jgi:hypothetical protein
MPQETNSTSNEGPVLALEREILQALCSSPHLNSERGRLLAALSSHGWRDAEHRVIYEALLRLPSREGGALRLELPATATRMGFPDIEWANYFGPGVHLQSAEVENRIYALPATQTPPSSHP